MQPTVRLFDLDSHLYTFTATVLATEAGEEPARLAVILDGTAFFPEGGGQYADPGVLAGCPVLDVQETARGDGARVIRHTVDVSALAANEIARRFAVGATVTGVLDTDVRLVRMQNHTGEHIVSGIVHRRWGYANVGFHLGDGFVTLDFDGVLTREQLDEVEDEANRVIRACLPVRTAYPDADTLAAMQYRSKLELSENVRIVEIGEPDALIDRCACCAPHVLSTGEIGVLKLLDFVHYKGGVRINMLCGAWALCDYRRRYIDTATIAAALSVKQEDVPVGFARMQSELEEKKRTIATLRGKVQALTVAAIPATEGSICYFDEGLEAVEMRHLLNSLTPKCGRLCGVFSGNDRDGYRFVIGRGDKSIDLKAHGKTICAALSARGGGSSEMLQGSSSAARAVIEAFFAGFEA